MSAQTPFPGPTPFALRDPRYRDRARPTHAIAASVLGARLLILHGRSGVGKSSLMRALTGSEVGAHAVVINANGRFDEIMTAVKALGLRVKSPHPFTTADGDEAIEQGFVDWDGNLVLLYEIRD